MIYITGKSWFKAYKKVLDACKIPFAIIADRDYLRQIGDAKIKNMFKVDEAGIKEDVLEDPTSTKRFFGI